ncbi:hypothetical protein CTI12_AA515020 [Artemisia annua]|uniref:Uncharacterized protein n=1 Tax=Artemisia annua TaxID=35608 RepID=A0A2U1L8G9_ARTAN|nr:hypothetical protein CTI12_AA515020 [Artemisia annua]
MLFTNNHCKDALVNPGNSSGDLCKKLRLNLNDTDACVTGSKRGAVFVKKRGSFIITDDLNVIPVMLDTSISLLNSLGVEYIDLLEERTVDFGFEEFSNLLKWSMVTNNPLTNLVLGGRKPCSCLCPYSSSTKSSTLINSPLISSYTSQPQTIKLLVQKSQNKLPNHPIRRCKRLTMDHSSSMGINNLYNSISSLGDGKYLKSEEIKAMLLSPKLSANYHRVTDLLPIYDKSKVQGSFLKEKATFIVFDDLEVTLSPSLSIISKFNTLGVPVGDIEVVEVCIGEQEVLLILKAALSSTSALTNCLSAFRKAKVVDLKIAIDEFCNDNTIMVVE